MGFIKRTYVLLLIIIMMVTGCSWLGNSVTTESGKELSKAFKSVNLTLEGSKKFYAVALSSAGDAYEKGYINDEQKDEIIKYAKKYKKIHNDATVAVMDWYDAIENEDDNLQSTRERALSFLFDMTKSGKELNSIIKKYVDDKIEVSSKYAPTFFKVIESLKPILVEEGI